MTTTKTTKRTKTNPQAPYYTREMEKYVKFAVLLAALEPELQAVVKTLSAAHGSTDLNCACSVLSRYERLEAYRFFDAAQKMFDGDDLSHAGRIMVALVPFYR